MRYYDKKGCEFHIYESLHECIEQSKGHLHKFEDWRSSSFVGRSFKSEREVVEAVESYWSEGVSVVDAMLLELEHDKLPRPASRKRRLRWDEYEGDEVDLDRMRAGQSFWRRSKRDMVVGQQTVTIISDFGANAYVPAKDILWRGAAAVTLTKLLEEAGYRVELWGGEYASGSFTDGTDCGTAVLLKRPQDPLNTPTLINACSGWFFRSVIFASFAESKRRLTSGYGSHSRIQNMLDEFSMDQNRIVIHGVWSHQAAVELIRSTIESLQPAERRR